MLIIVIYVYLLYTKILIFVFRYRGEILEIIDNVTAKVGLIDVGNFNLVRNIREIFRMPSKYKGKSLVSTNL